MFRGNAIQIFIILLCNRIEVSSSKNYVTGTFSPSILRFKNFVILSGFQNTQKYN